MRPQELRGNLDFVLTRVFPICRLWETCWRKWLYTALEASSLPRLAWPLGRQSSWQARLCDCFFSLSGSQHYCGTITGQGVVLTRTQLLTALATEALINLEPRRPQDSQPVTQPLQARFPRSPPWVQKRKRPWKASRKLGSWQKLALKWSFRLTGVLPTYPIWTSWTPAENCIPSRPEPKQVIMRMYFLTVTLGCLYTSGQH